MYGGITPVLEWAIAQHSTVVKDNELQFPFIKCEITCRDIPIPFSVVMKFFVVKYLKCAI